MYPQKQLKFINEKLMKRQLCTSNLYLKIQILELNISIQLPKPSLQLFPKTFCRNI